jgi:hypothetical protein
MTATFAVATCRKQERNCYTNLPSAIRPVPHGSGIPVPVPPEVLEDTTVGSDKEDTDSDQDFQCDPCSTEPELFSQRELKDLVGDLGLSKDSAEVLGLGLNQRIYCLLAPLSHGTGTREKEFIPYFSLDGDFVYCSDVFGLMEKFNIEYDVNEWRLFIDSSKISLKAVLLQSGSKYASVPVAILCALKKVMRIWL